MKVHQAGDVVRPGESIGEGTPSPLPPIAPDGGFAGMPAPLPGEPKPFLPEHVPCLRNCRHFMQVEMYFDNGNLGHTDARATHIYCTAIPSAVLEMTRDEPVYECNRWDPADEHFVDALELRRKRYTDKFMPDYQE